MERENLHQLYLLIHQKDENIIVSSHAALGALIEDIGFDTKISPYEYFAMVQFSLTARELRARMAKSILDCEDIRDHMENLYCLYMDFVEMNASKGARVSLRNNSYRVLKTLIVFLIMHRIELWHA